MFFGAAPRILAIGAHPDDIELGCGGLIVKLIKHYHAQVDFLILTQGVKHRDPKSRYDETSRRHESIIAAGLLGVHKDNVRVCKFIDCGLHEVGHEIVRTIEMQLAEATTPYNLVITHSGGDAHADHREAHEATISAVRYFAGTVFHYPSPSTKPNSFHPTLFVSLDQETMDQKTHALQAHASQRDKPFMKHSRICEMAAAWIQYHRMDIEYSEAFEVYKSFW